MGYIIWYIFIFLGGFYIGKGIGYTQGVEDPFPIKIKEPYGH